MTRQQEIRDPLLDGILVLTVAAHQRAVRDARLHQQRVQVLEQLGRFPGRSVALLFVCWMSGGEEEIVGVRGGGGERGEAQLMVHKMELVWGKSRWRDGLEDELVECSCYVARNGKGGGEFISERLNHISAPPAPTFLLSYVLLVHEREICVPDDIGRISEQKKRDNYLIRNTPHGLPLQSR